MSRQISVERADSALRASEGAGGHSRGGGALPVLQTTLVTSAPAPAELVRDGGGRKISKHG